MVNKDININQISEKQKKDIILVNAHYYYSDLEFLQLQKELYDSAKKMGYICPNKFIKEQIKNAIRKYIKTFNLQDSTPKILNKYCKTNVK